MVTEMRLSDDVRRRMLELAAVIATGVAHVSYDFTGWSRLPFIVVFCTAWGAWLIWRLQREPEVLDRLGLRRQGLSETAHVVLLLGVPAGLGMFLYGLLMGHMPPWWVVGPILLYPLFGLVQQLVILPLVAGNLSGLKVFSGRPWLVTAIVAVPFGLVHLSHGPFLVLATMFLAGMAVPLFLRWRNLWPLAVAHGWLGTLAFYAVMNDDPFGRGIALIFG